MLLSDMHLGPDIFFFLLGVRTQMSGNVSLDIFLELFLPALLEFPGERSAGAHVRTRENLRKIHGERVNVSPECCRNVPAISTVITGLTWKWCDGCQHTPLVQLVFYFLNFFAAYYPRHSRWDIALKEKRWSLYCGVGFIESTQFKKQIFLLSL